MTVNKTQLAANQFDPIATPHHWKTINKRKKENTIMTATNNTVEPTKYASLYAAGKKGEKDKKRKKEEEIEKSL